MQEKEKKLLQTLIGTTVIAALGALIFSLVWLPLAIPFVLIICGSIATNIRKYFLFAQNREVVIVACIWGGLMAVLARFGCLYANSPLWFIVFTYLIGVFPAGYIGYRTDNELFVLKASGTKDYHVGSQALGIIVYAGTLAGLHFLQ